MTALTPDPSDQGEAQPVALQPRVHDWMLDCFGAEIAADKVERSDRFIEEALELTQAVGYTADRAHALVDYVFGRPIGEPSQEVGGVMITLAALCNTFGLDINDAAATELARITQPEIVLKIRAKQAAKPTGSALPVAHPAPEQAGEVERLRGALEELHNEARGYLDDISAAIGPDSRFMDPPDGGDVSLAEQVRRMRVALEAAEQALADMKAERAWRLDMEAAPRDRMIIAMARYPDATAGAPCFVVWQDGKGWCRLGRHDPEPMICWAWMPREALGTWPEEPPRDAKP